MTRRVRLGLSAIAASGAIVLAAPANAQDRSQVVRDAVIDLCPELMEIETPLSEHEGVAGSGFLAGEPQEHPRMGTVDVVFRAFDDGGRIQILNSRDASFCQVGFTGPDARDTFDKLLNDAALIADNLSPDQSAASPDPRIKMTTLRTAAIDGVYLGVQFVDLTEIDPDAPLMVQQYVLEEE